MHVAMQLDSVTASSWLHMLPPSILTACCHKTNSNIFFPPFWARVLKTARKLPAVQSTGKKKGSTITADITLTVLLSSHESQHMIVDQKQTDPHFCSYGIQTNRCFTQTTAGKANLMLGSLGCELPAHLRPETRARTRRSMWGGRKHKRSLRCSAYSETSWIKSGNCDGCRDKEWWEKNNKHKNPSTATQPVTARYLSCKRSRVRPTVVTRLN